MTDHPEHDALSREHARWQRDVLERFEQKAPPRERAALLAQGGKYAAMWALQAREAAQPASGEVATA